ncbi:RNA-directed DNA polymerase, eukaryota, reverse transcriptase zinc-binding domain protein [Tanacetum coccineum]|uniref:RNA-directed DNA polymerase, eukaryota, reverse transcriptase zinc-binding domain protein n=1 Tax=Tanacetum coccineum TaxID=301880 RepID=A0ABQ4ZC50_9ASTR
MPKQTLTLILKTLRIITSSVVHANHKSSNDNSFRVKTRAVTLNDHDLISVDDTSKVLLVKLKDLGSACNMYVICKNEGFADLKIHHVGGAWIWIQFPTSGACAAFRSNGTMISISSLIRTVSPSFKVDERLIWIDISGLPLCAWGTNAFKKVAGLFGKFLFFKDEQTAAMCTGRVCISTKSLLPISKKVKVEVHGEIFETQVHEIGTWNINIVDESDISSNNDENDIEKVADTFDDNSVNDLDDAFMNLNNDKEGEENNVESPKANVKDSQPAKEDNVSDLSCPPGFEHLKRGYSRTCSTSFARHRNKDIKGVQESKMTRLEMFRLKSMWGNYSFNYACSLARGRSGGLISMWDPNNFVKEDIWCDDAFIIVKGQWKNTVGDCFMVNIYGPHNPLAKIELWNRIRDFMHTNRGKYILFGDMNEVRNAQERVGSMFSRNEAEVFNNFINDSNLSDLPLGGHSFTWMNKQGTKLSKLDRFLIFEEVINLLPDIRITALDRLWSDHIPILLHCCKRDFGPIPFKIYHSWFNREGFDEVIKTELAHLAHNNGSSSLLYHEKLKALKPKIKLWHSNTRSKEGSQKHEALNSLKILDDKIEAGSASNDDRDLRINLLQEVDKLDNLKAMDTIQKSRIKWDIEGDKNSKFFHSLINQKRRGLGSKPVSNHLGHGPSSEFNVRQGLRQGDPLSPFLFIIIMEGLHVALSDSIRNGLIRGINFGTSDINLSHLFFADDVVITTEWSMHDMENIIRIFQIFYLASGLKINIHKSNIYSIGVSSEEIHLIAANTSYSSGSFPFNYLGLPIGSNMSLTANWKSLVDKFHLKLSSWKANLLSFGGRLTLIKAVLGSLGIYYFSLFKAPKVVLKSLEKSRASFFWGSSQGYKKLAWIKWTNILASYNKGGLAIEPCMEAKAVLNAMGAISTVFGLGLSVLPITCIRVLSSPWIPFIFKYDLRCQIDDHILPSLDSKTTWDKTLPRKVNIFMWRLKIDRLPRRLNLSSRGIEIPEISCPSCNGNVESNHHIFFGCEFAKEVWKNIRRWCEDSFPLFDSNSHWIDWLDSWPVSGEKKHRLLVIIAAFL